MIDLILSAFADEYSANFDDQLTICKELNVPNIELRFIDGKNVSTLTDEEVEETAKKLEQAGVGVSAIGSPIGKICLTDDMEAHLAMAERVFAMAKRFQAKYVRVFSFYLPEGKTREECRAEVLAALERLITLAEKYGVTLCHENEARIYGESPEYCLDILEYFGGRLKAVFDMPVYARFIERTGVEKTYGPYYYTEGDTIPSYTPKRNGYTFDGWYKDNAQHQNFPITLTANTVSAVTYDFYAQWKANTYTITYYIDGVYSHQETYSMSEADNGGYSLNVPNKLGHVFSGWKINNSGAVITEINNTGVAEENKTYGNLSLYGTFEKATYSITFISGGEIVKVVYVQYGDTLQSQNSWVGTNGSKLAVPAGKNGFLGFQDQYGNQLIDQNGNWINGGTYTWTDNIELTAWWY